MPPQLFSQNIFLQIPPRKNLEIFANGSRQNLDRDQLCTILHNFATTVTSRSTIIGYIQVFLKTEPLIGRNYLACCSSTGCIEYIRLLSAADTTLLLYSLLCLCRTYSMLLLYMTDQWAVCLYR